MVVVAAAIGDEGGESAAMLRRGGDDSLGAEGVVEEGIALVPQEGGGSGSPSGNVGDGG